MSLHAQKGKSLEKSVLSIFVLFLLLQASSWAACLGDNIANWNTSSANYSTSGTPKVRSGDSDTDNYTITVAGNGGISISINNNDSTYNLVANVYSGSTCSGAALQSVNVNHGNTQTITINPVANAQTYSLWLVGNNSSHSTDYTLSGLFTVVAAETPPTFTGTIPSQTATISSAFTFNASTYFTQTNGDAITYSNSGTLPAGVTLNSTTGVLSGTPTTIGTYSNIIITATDNDGSTNSNSFTFTVQPVKVGFDKLVYQTFEDTASGYDTSSLVSLTVNLSQAVDYPITVNCATHDGTAIATSGDGTDYYSQNSLVTFAIGETSKIIPIAIIHDEPIELDENFTVVLTNPQPSSTVQLDTNSTATVTILGQVTAPVCYADNFNTGTAIDNSWRVLKSSGTYNPGYVGGRMQLTDAVGNRATAITKDYQFRASQNIIIAEFTHYAYGGSGADGISLVLYDTMVGANPTVGAFGGSLGYAQKSNPGSDCTVVGGCPGFQGGWIGLGIDEFGNYSNPTEGRIGGTGKILNSVAIRGKGSGQSGYSYLGGTGALTPILWNSGATANPGDKFKMTVDARDPTHLYITLERDTGSGYQVVVNKFDAIASQGASPAYVRLAFTGSTGGSTNIHEIDDLIVSGICGPFTTATTVGVFDAWDTSRSISDRNISTKIASQDFNLTIASLNSANNGVQAKPLGRGAYYRLWDSTANAYKTPYIFFDANASASITSPAFNISSATKDMKVQFKFCADYNGTAYDVKQDITCLSQNVCHPTLVTNNTPCYREQFSTDDFAIRPDSFALSAPSGQNINLLTSAQDYSFPTTAKQYGSATATNDYNITAANLVLSLARTMYQPSNTVDDALHGTPSFSATPFDITDGVANALIKFDDVGKVNIQLRDTTWASVDSDDTSGDCNTTGRYVCGDINATFIPDHFTLSAVHLNNNGAQTFTYLSNDLNMSAHLDVTVSAKNFDNNTTQNFKSGSWENPVDVNMSVVSAASTPPMIKDDINETQNLGFNLGAIIIPWNETNATKKLMFNFNRSVNDAKNPFLINGSEVTLGATSTYTDSGTAKIVAGSSISDQNATFTYGRTHAPRYRFSTDTDTAFIYYESFCDSTDSSGTVCNKALLPNGTSSLSMDDPRWFINTSHTSVSGTAEIVSQKNGTDIVTATAPSNANPAQTTLNYTASATKGYPYKTTMENSASSWLIYNKYNSAATKNEFEVEFEGSGSSWSGKHETNTTTNKSGTDKTNRRTMW
ncbi:MAG: putative Ig domain-containing protein [Sulfurimonas sp.]|jgi:hypothetical protein